MRLAEWGSQLPEISRFLGVVIRMYYEDHMPPHFHAAYGDYEIVVRIGDGTVEGKFPRRSIRHVLEWYTLHREELEANWKLADQRRPLDPIPPLE